MELSPHCGRSEARIRGGGGRWRTGENREIGVALHLHRWAQVIGQPLIGATPSTGDWLRGCGERGGGERVRRQEQSGRGGVGCFTLDQYL
ncbi:hypothetical protein PoB_000784600 [Plakobranchus ocellatus]|uniref:Uncharacterized protein n=1 Tax=Plakobranchus ocellatus TaxID=259542 RepID=A0AAV3YG39_9GAST|nr:hypothetical protein PoB_000784600 [Plakobranchus ocellatus]